MLIPGNRIQVLLELRVRQLVSVFVLPVPGHLLLDCVVGQVDFGAVGVGGVHVELGRGGAQVALFEEVAFSGGTDEHPHSDVEFASVDQERSLDVFLDDEFINLL